MKITEIYKKYKIPKNLQEHQLKVAAVASTICDNFKQKIDKKSVITAALLHDMGNIIKFDLGKFPEFLEPEGIEYWQQVKEEFRKKYGEDEHDATYKIAEEIGVNKSVFEIIQGYGFSKYEQTYKNPKMEVKIAAYSDHRVTPYGIASLQARIDDLKKRYSPEESPSKEAEYYHKSSLFAKKVEKQIFENCKIKPEDIIDKNVNPLIKKLKDFDINKLAIQI